MKSGTPRGPRAVGVLVLVAVNLLLFLVLELAVRAYFTREVGTSALLYGTPWHRMVIEPPDRDGPLTRSVQYHRNQTDDYQLYGRSRGYAKYFPHEKKVLPHHSGRRVDVRINNHGFRGADFEITKAPGVVRVLTLGASSTFGYRNADDETYPHLLQIALDREAEGDPRFEVINLSVPHATSDNVLALFLAEGLSLEPDVVTLYAGVNDSVLVEPPQGIASQTWWALRQRLLTAAWVHHLAGALGPPARRFREEDTVRRSEVFLDNVSSLREACREQGIHLIVANQQASSQTVEKSAMKGLTYADEIALVEDRLLRNNERPAPAGGSVGPRLRWRLEQFFDHERIFLTHARLMRDLDHWARANDVDFFDAIELLDRDRQLLLSWVHLHPQANAMLAEALAGRIMAAIRHQVDVEGDVGERSPPGATHASSGRRR